MTITKNKWTILIVDDEEAIHENLRFTLRHMVYGNEGVELMHAYTAAEAQKIIVAHPAIAVVILDVMMERDDAGLKFVHFLRDDANNQDTRVLLYTGQPSIAPKRDVAEQYTIDGYLDKNSTDNNDCYVAVRLALKCYEERLHLKASARKNDVSLLAEMAAIYVQLLGNSAELLSHEDVAEKLNAMLYLSQEILASYTLTDLKNGLLLGTTKKERLSRSEYDSLVSIHHLKIILNQIGPASYETEKEVLFYTLAREAQKFATLSILPDAARKSLEACLQNKRTSA